MRKSGGRSQVKSFTRVTKTGKTVMVRSFTRGAGGTKLVGREAKINSFYTSRGLKPPKGKGIHSVSFHKRAAIIMGSMQKSGKLNKNEAYAIAMKQLGRDKSVLKKHRR